MMCRKRSLEPVLNSSGRILILGSMPGEQSLRMQQYYAFPQNQFWRIAAVLNGFDPGLGYAEKCMKLKESGWALWDVIESCEREGSLDTSIKNEKPNDIPGLLDENPGIAAVFFNGAKAAAVFRKAFGKNFLEKRGLHSAVLPSTSPANTVPFEKKLERWRTAAEAVFSGLNQV